MERKIVDDGTCEFTWNPGVWPYITRCMLQVDHDGQQHSDKKGRQHVRFRAAPQDVLVKVESVVTILTEPSHRGPTLHRDKTRTLAMEWPELAAALGALVATCGKDIPGPLRHALKTLTEEGEQG